ncbi:MAG: 5-(carboxyamino)imidazole ribonucleotide synthase [Myxococcales bacterium]|jgi:5-(carboxyamino)imidazole ribonucleotide synthase
MSTRRQDDPLAPGATLGVLGGGQLARMMAVEARRMGYRVAVVDPDPHCSASEFADEVIPGALDDLAAARALSRKSAAVTVDTEHVPADVLERLEAVVPVRPASFVLRTVQDRSVQRDFLMRAGLPQPRNVTLGDGTTPEEAAGHVGLPCVLKTRRSGYDGKGQARARTAQELGEAWERMARAPAVVESFVDFECEISVVLARGVDGEVRNFPVAENEHRNHVLYMTRAPARISPQLESRAVELATRVAEAFDHVGVLAVELFVTRDGQLLVNEVAPRTHNSGHFTLGGCATSQFEQHVRAICGLPLGDPSLLRPAAMVNLMGELWDGGAPDWEPILTHPSAHLHLYGKRHAYPGRKMGHALFLADPGGADPAEVASAQLDRCVRRSLPSRDPSHPPAARQGAP